MWICFMFPSLDVANKFVGDIAEGYRLRGVKYVHKWERPKRKKGGYWVAVCTDATEAIESLAGMWGGRRLAPLQPTTPSGEKVS